MMPFFTLGYEKNWDNDNNDKDNNDNDNNDINIRLRGNIWSPVRVIDLSTIYGECLSNLLFETG